MYKDVMSPRAFGRYNIYLVQLIGLAAAVYWELLYEIADLAYSKCERKETLNTKGYFTVDRKYVRDRTGLSTEDQRTLDRAFMKMRAVVVSEDDPDALYVDNSVMLSFLTGADTNTEKKKFFAAALSDGKLAIKEQKSAGKKAGMINRWKSWIHGSPELVAAYAEAFSVWYGFGWQTDAMIQAKINLVEQSSDDELFKIDVLKRAAQSGYKDLEILVKKAKQEYNPLKAQRAATTIGSTVF